jgi:prevent-host-death family protein
MDAQGQPLRIPYTMASVFNLQSVYTVGMTTMAEHAGDQMQEVSIVDLRAQLGRLIDEAHYKGTAVAITRHGRRMAVLCPPELFERLMSVHDASPASGDSAAA